jgi:glycosyltransferase involved in cell wall biosynthesis
VLAVLRNNILIISPDIIGEKMAGPGIRYLNIAKCLSREHNVILLVPNEINSQNYDWQVMQINKNVLKTNLKSADAVLVQGLALMKYPEIVKSNKPLIVDLYDPFMLENLELRKNQPLENQLFEYDRLLIIEQLKYGDYFLCSSERQKDFWLGMLTAVGRVNPITYSNSPTLDCLITLLPFGLPKDQPLTTKKVLKGVHPQIRIDDKVFLWGGGIWDWLDPLTPIRALHRLQEYEKNAKLFFMGIKHPNSAVPMSQATIDAMQLAKSLGMIDDSVIFNDWVAYDERLSYLQESDAGLSIHKNHLETRFAFRTRILDYIWASLPIISTSGDSMADLVYKENLGYVVEPENTDSVYQAFLQIVRDTKGYEIKKRNLESVKEKLYWENNVAGLLKFCDRPYKQADKLKGNQIFKYQGRVLYTLSKHPMLYKVLNKLKNIIKR